MAFSAFAVALVLGLVSTVHCLGMCGGIIGALSIGLPEEVRRRPGFMGGIIGAYNLGRISSYAVAGAIAGAFGQLLVSVDGPVSGHRVLQLMAAVILILLGLHIAGWLPRLQWLEGAGMKLWSLIHPLGRQFLPVDSLPKGLLIGMLWGWLPCGLVYSVLLWSVSSGDPLAGFFYMLAFGIGTLPGMISAGLAGASLRQWFRLPSLRKVLGCMIIAYALTSPMLLSGSGHASDASADHPHSH